MPQTYQNTDNLATAPFSHFCALDRADLPNIVFNNSLTAGSRFYMASPKALYGTRPYKTALHLIREHAPDTPDTSTLFQSDEHWIAVFPGIFATCTAFIALTRQDGSLSPGAHAEFVWAHAHGLPLAIMTWTDARDVRCGLQLWLSGSISPDGRFGRPRLDERPEAAHG